MRPRFDNTYLHLPETFYSHIRPQAVSDPQIIRVNEPLAEKLGFEPSWLKSSAGAAFAVGNQIIEGSEPIATAYGGHQFGNWAGQLGDGRASLLGEVLSADGERFDVQLKGSGPTPYSRGGDGRAPLGPVLREYIVSEAMAALNIPTTRALAAATTGEMVRRQKLHPGAVLVRVARSHIRVGTFELFASRDDAGSIHRLAQYVLARHFPEIQPSADDAQELSDEILVALLSRVARRQAKLVAKWALVGFIHGVMNTDNMLLSGETIDYGPCAFMEEYDHAAVFSSIDHYGRYAYGNQPKVAQWNISRLAVALLGPTGASEEAWARAQKIIDTMPGHFQSAYLGGMREKLGLATPRDEDESLFNDLLELMREERADYTLIFLRLGESLTLQTPDARQRALREAFGPPPAALGAWVDAWKKRLASEQRAAETCVHQMRGANPLFIPRNHRINQAIEKAEDTADFGHFHRLVDVLSTPFTFQPEHLDLAQPAGAEERVEQTFCGT